MSAARTTEVAAAVALIRQAMEKIENLNRTPREGVATNGITVMLQDIIRRIEALDGDEGE
jgi:Ni,Fe-hydrogenase III large subunit